MIHTRFIRRMGFVLIAVFLWALMPMSAVTVGATETAPPRPSEQPTTSAPQVKNETERRVSDLRSTVEKEVEQKRLSKTKDTAGDKKRKTFCENRQKAINNKLAAFTQSADKHLTKLNETFDKVQAYQTARKLPLANYAELVAAATENKQTAVDTVAALKVVAQNVDCAQPDTVVKLSTVRDAAKAARQALHEYRMSIKDIVVALLQAEDGLQSEGAVRSSAPVGASQ